MGLTLATMYTAEKLFSCQTGLSRLPTISFCAFADVTTDRPSFLTLLLTYMGMRRNFVVDYDFFFKQCRIRNFGYFVTADFPLGMRNCKATKFRPIPLLIVLYNFVTLNCTPTIKGTLTLFNISFCPCS